MPILRSISLVSVLASMALISGCQTQSTHPKPASSSYDSKVRQGMNISDDNCQYTPPPSTEITHSKTDYAGLGIVREAGMVSVENAYAGTSVPSAFIISKLGGCQTHVFHFPSLHTKEPYLKGIHFVLENDRLVPVQLLPSQGTVRASADIVLADGTVGVVIADHGLEPPETASNAHLYWPYGDISLIRRSDNGSIKMEVISEHKGFYHGVSVGDLNGDGFDDVVADNMGLRVPGKPVNWKNSLTAYVQTETGDFRPKGIFSDEKNSNPGGGSVLVEDLNKDGRSDVIHGKYSYGWKEDFQILERRGSRYVIAKRVDTDKVSCTTSIHPIDYDRDGDLDLAIGTECDQSGPGLELYRNDGRLNFSRVSDAVFPEGLENIDFREFVVTDVDFDGFPDLVLNAWEGNRRGSIVDFGRYVYKNENGQRFRNLKGQKSLEIAGETSYNFFFKAIPNEGLSFIGVSTLGTKTVVRFSQAAVEGTDKTLVEDSLYQTTKSQNAAAPKELKFDIRNMPTHLISDLDVCLLSIVNSKWSTNSRDSGFVAEARSRGLTEEWCTDPTASNLSSAGTSDTQLCERGFDRSTLDWRKGIERTLLEQAKKRNLTPMRCFKILN